MASTTTKHINYKSDFSVIMTFPFASGVTTNIPTWNWTMTFSVGNVKKTFKQINGMLSKGMQKISDSQVEVFFSNHGFPTGAMSMEFSEAVPNSRYSDGYRKNYAPQSLPIYLWDDASDDYVDIDITIENCVGTVLESLFDAKVDKVEGMGLSSNDYTDAEKKKVEQMTKGLDFDTELNEDSESAVQNKVIYSAFKTLEDDLETVNKEVDKCALKTDIDTVNEELDKRALKSTLNDYATQFYLADFFKQEELRFTLEDGTTETKCFAIFDDDKMAFFGSGNIICTVAVDDEDIQLIRDTTNEVDYVIIKGLDGSFKKVTNPYESQNYYDENYVSDGEMTVAVHLSNDNLPANILPANTTAIVKCTNVVVNSTNISKGFYKLTKLVSADVSGMNLSNVTAINNLFNGCTSLEKINGLKAISASAITDITGAFNTCKSLTELDLSNWQFGNAVQGRLAFAGCTSLKKLNLSGWDFSHFAWVMGLWKNCTSLETLDLSDCNLGTDETSAFEDAFLGCTSLKNIITSNKTTLGQQSYNVWRLEQCVNLTEESLVNILNALPKATEKWQIKLGAVNIAKLTNEEKAIATNKGWTLLG